MLRLTPTILLLTLSASAEPPASLTLPEAIRLARANHPALRAARAQSTAAEAQVSASKAPLLPQIGGAIGYQRMTGNVEPRPGQIGASPEASFEGFNRFSASVALNQLIWDFGQTTKRWEAAQASVAAARTNERTAELDVVVAVRVAFATVLGNRELIRVATERFETEERHLREAEAFVAAEVRPAIEVAKSRALLASARAQRIAVQGAFESALEQLAQAMGGPLPGREVEGGRVGPTPGEDDSADRLVERALEARPELRTLLEQRRAQSLVADAARGGYWPTFELSLGMTDAGVELTNLGWNMSAGVFLSWNFYAGGATKAAVDEAEARAVTMDANLEVLGLAIRAEIASAVVDIRSAKGQLAASEEGLTSAAEQLRLAEARYASKLGGGIELSDAAAARASAAGDVVTAAFRLSLARIRLSRALGEDP